MKRILLISNKVMHYRIRIYNSFFCEFQKMGYEFHVLANEFQDVHFEISFIKHLKSFSVRGYIDEINIIKPDVVINFLHLKDGLIIQLTFYCRLKKIPMIYWNHGINIKTPNAKFKNFIFHFIHTISDAIILYSDQQLKYIQKRNHKKTFIACNTLDFSDVNTKRIKTKEEVKMMYNIKEEKVVLYISRILPYKGLTILLNQLKECTNIALVIVGSGMINEIEKKIIDETSHYYYLGEKYGYEVDEIYNMGDVFSTPGHIGLALNQAFFWGKPVVVLNRIHAPEICYLKNGYNGFIVDSEVELGSIIQQLCLNKELWEQVSSNARTTYEKEMKLENMFRGFKEAITYVIK